MNEYIDDYLDALKKADKDLKIHQPYSKRKIDDIKADIVKEVERGLQPYSIFKKENWIKIHQLFHIW